MLSENIRKYRKECGLSQEELAIKLHVVRQTVSKWESDLSVPDADMLVKLSEILNVSVSCLLDHHEDRPIDNISKELTHLNNELANQIQENRRLQLYHKKRNIIVYLSFLALCIALLVKQAFIAIPLMILCVMCSLWVLYRNLSLLALQTSTPSKKQFHALRISILFSACMILLFIGYMLLQHFGIVNEESEMGVSIIFIIAFILFLGYISPKLPYTRFVGLRLPWTVSDEETWYLAHRIIGYISIPITIFMLIGLYLFPDKEKVILACAFSWIGIPSIFSLIFYYRKFH